MNRLSGKVAVVTGGARNIGQAIVLRLARDGARVLMNYGPGTEVDAEETVAQAKAFGGEVWAEPGDLSAPEAMPMLLRNARERFGRIDVLVNNAAITGRRAPLSALSVEDFERVFAVNTRAVFLGMKAAAELLQDGGRVISIASSTTLYPKPDLGIYAASKAAVRALSEAFATEAGRRGITVNTVMPGPVVPGVFQDAPPSRQEELRQASPFGRLGEPTDIADVVAFLASDDARWITGQHILVNGGSQN